MEKIFYVENLGCAKNQVDAEVMIAALERHGWQRRREASGGASGVDGWRDVG